MKQEHFCSDGHTENLHNKTWLYLKLTTSVLLTETASVSSPTSCSSGITLIPSLVRFSCSWPELSFLLLSKGSLAPDVCYLNYTIWKLWPRITVSTLCYQYFCAEADPFRGLLRFQREYDPSNNSSGLLKSLQAHTRLHQCFHAQSCIRSQNNKVHSCAWCW